MTAKKAASQGLGHSFEAANDDDGARSWTMPQPSEAAELEPVVSAAVLVTVAFRLKDERGLVVALRSLATAVDALEHRRKAE